METVDQDLDRLISKRASQDRRPDPDEVDVGYLESVRRYNARRREQNRWEWVRFFDRMAASHRALSEDYERRAAKLCEEGGS